jgi:hypothetical protein
VRYLITLAALLLLNLCSCDMFKEGADSTKGGGEGAVGIADKMSDGTLKDADMDSGESSSDSSEDASGDE